MSAVLQLECVPSPEACASLTDLRKGETGRIVALSARHPQATADLLRRLSDLGFLPGELARVVARGPFGAEPIAVRIGTATFALRRLEADCIQITPLGG